MSVSIKKRTGVDDTRIFILEDKAAVLPPGVHKMNSKDQAKQLGFYAAAMILADPRVSAITLFSSSELKEYEGGPWDCLAITLKPGTSWDNLAKTSATQLGGQLAKAEPKTVARSYAEIIEREFIHNKKPFYSNPQAIGNDADIMQKIDLHLKQSYMAATPNKEKFNEKVARGERTTVYDTIKSDKGHVRAESYANGVLTVVFSGNCGNNCKNDGDTSATETGLKADLVPAFPYIRKFNFERQG